MSGPAASPHIVTSDGVELVTRSWPSVGTASAIVVLVHGLSATKDHPAVVALAEMISAGGVDVISYDARGHGESDGYSTLGDLERHDVAAAVQLARSRHPRVALVGASMGAIAALAYAQDDPDLAGLVVVSSPGDWRIPFRLRSLATVLLTRTGVGRRYSARSAHVRITPTWNPPEPPRAVVPRVSSVVPLAIVHGRRDRLIPFQFSLNVTAAELPEAHAVVVPGMGHAFDPVGHAAICEALWWVLSVEPRNAGQALATPESRCRPLR